MAYLHMKIKRFPVYVLAMILKMLAIGIGLLFFIIPGLLFLLAFYFMEYFIIDRDMSLMDAFRESWKMTKGFRIGIFFFEVNLFIIGYILAFPQSLWPDTLMTYAIIVLISIIWLPISWNAQGWIYQFVSTNQIDK
jgi:protein-S-isoprenylcysteine O-methyltransferase Ste14